MAYAKKKFAKKMVSPRKRKAPAPANAVKKQAETMAGFLWMLCALGGSNAVLGEFLEMKGAYRRLSPAAKEELTAIAEQINQKLRSVYLLVQRAHLESGTGASRAK